MKRNPIGTGDVPTQVKNPDLVEQRRRQIVEAAVPLFAKNGFHKTTTRQIAKATGLSVGSMYEYVTSKEDILYLVCISIHDQVEQGVENALSRATGGRSVLAEIIREFFMVCHRMSDQILLMYQVTKDLPSQWKKKVLENDIGITDLFVSALQRLASTGDLPSLSDRSCDLVAQNITVLGHMWTFRRWYLARHYSLEEYIEFQTDFILGTIVDTSNS
ncbi:MAG: TetR/AcrR family transcriptional regulator [Proteobacteria bacterium]|nr:TetR/AcrR family transcriptional regulator [Pseudomonadota bacterium]